MNISATQSGQSWSALSALASNLSTARTSASNATSQGTGSDFSMPQGGQPPEGPPPGPPPSDSNLASGMSTAQFAGLSSFDSDEDGAVSSDEFGLDGADDRAAELFASVDSDGDGSLSSDEIDAFESAPQSQGPQGGPGGPGGMPPPQGGDPIASLDSDGDDAVSSSEFGVTDGDTDSDVAKLFAAIDSDGSGDLSSDEVDSFREQMQTQMASADGSVGADQAGHRPPPPPRGEQGDDSTSSSSSASSQLQDAASFVQQLAARYASMQADRSNETSSLLAAA